MPPPVSAPTTTLLAFPVRRAGTDYASAAGNDLIEEAIRQIVLTEPGELPWRPRFGVGLEGLLHESNDATTAEIARVRIADGLRLWAPQGTSVRAVVPERDDTSLKMLIGYAEAGSAQTTGIATVDLAPAAGVT